MWKWQGDRAILARFDGETEHANAVAHAAAEAARALAEVADAVPGARTLLVRLAGESEPSPELLRLLEEPPQPASAGATRIRRIGVAYGGEDGPDLAAVAERAGMSPGELVRLHTSLELRVAFVGFMPGFAYLLGLPEQLRLPRLSTPRRRVPAGSVAIAERYCGIYPSPSPGGWHLLGRTEAKLFDAHADPPARLQPGDRVVFEAL